MNIKKILLLVAFLAGASSAAADAMPPAIVTTTADAPNAVEVAQGVGYDNRATLNWTLPREALQWFKTAQEGSTGQKQAWCIQQGRMRPEGSDLFRATERLLTRCHDRATALSGTELLIHSALQLAVRQARSVFAD